jgi:hypothetical protein
MQKVALTYLLIFAALNFAFIFPSGPNTYSAAASVMITWEDDEPLRWSDFKGKARNWGGISALTASAIEYAYDCYDGTLDLDVRAIFIPEESWVKTDAKTEYILAHEQLHFDITEIYARKLRRELSEKVTSCRDIWKIERIAGKLISEWKEVQQQYDKDTHHSINRELQERWEEKVEFDLEAYAGYSLSNWKADY